MVSDWKDLMRSKEDSEVPYCNFLVLTYRLLSPECCEASQCLTSLTILSFNMDNLSYYNRNAMTMVKINEDVECSEERVIQVYNPLFLAQSRSHFMKPLHKSTNDVCIFSIFWS